MRKLIVLTVVGFFAQLIDGALGMAYGVTSSSLMLASGLAPAAASASVHLAEIGTTAASAAAHARFGNVDWRMVRRLGVPGAIGAFAGATFLSSLSTSDAMLPLRTKPCARLVVATLPSSVASGVGAVSRLICSLAATTPPCGPGSSLPSGWWPGSSTPPVAVGGGRWPRPPCSCRVGWSPAR